MRLSEVIKKGSGAPTTGDLQVGGFGVDITNGKLYSKKSNGTIFEVGAVTFSDEDISGIEATVLAHTSEIAKLWATPSIQNDQSLTAIVKGHYDIYLRRVPTDAEVLYWVQEINRGNLSANDLEGTFYQACIQNGEKLYKTYISPEDKAKQDAWVMTINNAEPTLVADIKAWYISILKRYTIDDESLAYWITKVNQGNVLRADLAKAIFYASVKLNANCYLIPAGVTDWEIGDGGYAAPMDAIDDDIIDAPKDGGDVTTVDGVNIIIEASTYNIQLQVDYLNAHKPTVVKIINIYYTYFHRAPEVAGAYYWAYEYHTKSWTDEQLEEAIYKAGLLYKTPMFSVYDNSQTSVFEQAYKQAVQNLQDAQKSGDINYVNSASAAKSAAEITFVQAQQNDYATVTNPANKSVVDQIVALYGEVLGRPTEAIYADAAGVAYWTNQVTSGAISMSQMAQALESAAQEYTWYQGGSEWA